jgi:tyrosyl-tRNA synthetase
MSVAVESTEQINALLCGTEAVYTTDGLRAKLERAAKDGRALRIKLGLDPTAPDIHLGHTVQLRKMRQFQDLGHKAVLIIGDYTAQIGDPSGRSKTRPVLSPEQIEENAKTYLDQAGRVLDLTEEKIEIRHNSEWLSPMNFADVLRLAAKTTVGQMLKREDFRTRYEGEAPIGVHELLYPLMQAYDSVVVEADVELGGTDQTFNNLLGRDLQTDAGQEPQVVLIMPLLVGLDGREKMSKSLGNYVGVSDPPHDMFGKLMSVPDESMASYFRLLTDTGESEIDDLCNKGGVHPMDAKKRLARTVSAIYHGDDDAATAQAEWESIHQKSAKGGVDAPADTPEVEIPASLLDGGQIFAPKLVVQCGFASTNGEARRLIKEGGVRINGEPLRDPMAAVEVRPGDIVQRGKRKFVRLVVDGAGKGGGET